MIINFQYKIDIDQVFRYLGYKGRNNYPPGLLTQVKEAIQEMNQSIFPKALVEEFSLTIDKDQKRLCLSKGLYLSDKQLFETLEKSKFIIIAVITLGHAFSDKSFAGGQRSGIKELIKDAIGTVVLNDVSSQLRKSLVDKYEKKGFALTKRLSPGEKDIPLEVQNQIFQILDSKKIEVVLTKQMVMEPLKSYSMIYGAIRREDVKEDILCTNEGGCNECNLEKCFFREEEKRHKVVVIQGDKEIKVFSSHRENLFELLIRNGIPLANSCGGNHTCGKCIVYVESDLPIPIRKSEKELLQKQSAHNGRLACFIEVEQDLRVSLPLELPAQICVDSPQVIRQPDPRINNTESSSACGIAVDIGTTTVALYLLDFKSGNIIDYISFLNPQRKYGADVIARIDYTLRVKKGLEHLNKEIIAAINSAIGELCKRNALQPDDIHEMTVVGNTTMLYLFIGLPCTNLARAPYKPVYTAASKIEATELGVSINQCGDIVVLPGIAAFAGADTLAALGACGMSEDNRVNLLIDLGTNGEIVLGNKDRMVCCSTAAGPAFEGGRITFGVGGVSGAIDHVNFSWDKIFTTINNQEPVGICGSGVLDVAAELLRYDIIDKSGRLRKKSETSEKLSKKLKDRLIEKEGQTAFLLDKDSGIVFTQSDVRELQLAKGAIFAGINILLKEMAIRTSDIGKVYLAGGFGNYMDIASAEALKLIPQGLHKKAVSIGNAAGSGAQMALMSDAFYQNLKRAKGNVEYLELSLTPDFQTEYIKALDF